MRGRKVSLILILIAGVILVVILLAIQFGRNVSPPKQFSQQGFMLDHSNQNQTSRAFFEKDGVSFEQYWPRGFYAPHMKADETEILVYNESSKQVQFKSIKVEYFVDGVRASEKSGTWEKFPSSETWERTQYVNISLLHYRGEPLILQPGEKGKIHHHIEVSGKDIPSSKDQKVKINLVYAIDDEEVVLEKELVRDTPAVEGSGLENEEKH